MHLSIWLSSLLSYLQTSESSEYAMPVLTAEYEETLLCFPELQKNGDLPRKFKRPHMEAADKRPREMKTSHASRKNNRWPQEKKETQKEAMSRNMREREKHRKAARCHGDDQGLPRGPEVHSAPGSSKTQKSHKPFHHSSHRLKPREDRLPREGKRGKHKKEESCLEEGSNDNLFLIKQRKKKSKL